MPGWLIRKMRRDDVLTLRIGDRLVAELRVSADSATRATLGVRAHPCITLRHEAAPSEELPPCPDPSSSTPKP